MFSRTEPLERYRRSFKKNWHWHPSNIDLNVRFLANLKTIFDTQGVWMQPKVKPCRQSLYAEAFFWLHRFIISLGCLFWFLSQSCMLLVFVCMLCPISVSECILRLQMKYIVNWDTFNTKYIYYFPWNESFKICTMCSPSLCAMLSPNFCHLSLKCRMFVSCCLPYSAIGVCCSRY